VQDETTQGQAEPMELDEIIKDTCKATGTLDYAQIIANATKNISPEALVRQCVYLFPEPIMRRLLEEYEEALCDLIGGYEPEDVLREVIDDLITPEARLIYGSGVSPAAAKAFLRMQEADREQSNAEDALLEVIGSDLDAACQRVWDETHTTDPAEAAQAMMGSVPAMAQAFRDSLRDEPRMRQIFADYYSDFLSEQQRAGDGT
jgi:hypothetical protein